MTQSRTSDQALNAGDDIAGLLVSTTHPRIPAGSRVAAFHRMAKAHGGYAEYAVAPASTTFALPDAVSFEAAAGLPLSVITAALALGQYLGIPVLPEEGKEGNDVASTALVVYGGASAVGAYALQLAKLAGVKAVITVAGKGIDFVSSLDATTAIVDYRKGDVATGILSALSEAEKALNGGSKFTRLVAFDAISGHASYEHLTAALVSYQGGGELNMVDPPTDESWKFPPEIRFTRTFVSSAYGVPHRFITEAQAQSDAEFSEKFYQYLSTLLAEGKFKPHPVQTLPGGLEGIADGVQALFDGKVSATKLVAR